MNKFKVFATHVEDCIPLKNHEEAVNEFLNKHNVVKVTHNFDSQKIETWRAWGLSQILVTTIEYTN